MRVALVLAAGLSRRFGPRDKLRARLAGRTLLEHAIARARESGARRVILVTRPGQPVPGGVMSVRARDAVRGLSASLSAGLRRVRPIDREIVILLGDMPFAHLARDTRLRPGIDAVRPMVAGLPGHPMLVRSSAARRVRPSGDAGLLAALGRDRVAGVPGRPADLIDIDTPMALRAVRRRIAGAGGALPPGWRRRRGC